MSISADEDPSAFYHMKLEKGSLHLPGFDMDEERKELGINWTELMLIVQGIDPKKVKRSPRWISEKQATSR